MGLAGQVRIARRFQRSIRIDSDHNDLAALEGFVCPKSSVDVLRAVSDHVSKNGHGAFTWTGPYGSGKSSLALAFSALLGNDKKLRKCAETAIGKKDAHTIAKPLSQKNSNWTVVPVVGRREGAAQVIGEALNERGLIRGSGASTWTDAKVLSVINTFLDKRGKDAGGLILFIDEMGKLLEQAAQQEEDVYLFQLLAEASSRSDGRFLVIGILHQAFEEYANRLSREMRDEWSKIQGRYIDLPVNAAGEEQIEIISRAIERTGKQKQPAELSNLVFREIKRHRPTVSNHLVDSLHKCWPLHPVVASILGPISRRRFGQNQRSVFGFLNSAEPHGFQEFIQQNDIDCIYEPDKLWEYLKVNLEPSILASSDGHRWSMAAEAIERCEAAGGKEIHIKLLKSIALVDLFKVTTGLLPTKELLATCLHGKGKKKIADALEQLKSWSLIVYRKFNESFAIYAGSDFDIDQEVRHALENIRNIDFASLSKQANLQPILAKRHYHETGALRWFDVEIAPLDSLVDTAKQYRGGGGAIGKLILAIPTGGETPKRAHEICRKASQENSEWDIIAGVSEQSWTIIDLARELSALSFVQDEHPDLGGDSVAQREIIARKTILDTKLEREIQKAIDTASWYLKYQHNQPMYLVQSELNDLASKRAWRMYPETPILNNELLNRIKPSSNATGAQNSLMKAMVNREGEPRLDIEGYPAEGGLYDSLLQNTGLYADQGDGWRFQEPSNKDDVANLLPLWSETIKFLKKYKKRTVGVTEIYDLWSSAPFGLKDGLMPILIVAFIMSRREQVAVYRDSIFQANFKEIDIEVLARNPQDIPLRWMDLSTVTHRLLSSMADVVRNIDSSNSLEDLTPFDVGRGLISIYEGLHPFTKRTAKLSNKAIRVRDLFKLAKDPNKFLFDDIPETFAVHVDNNGDSINIITNEIQEGLEELVHSYHSTLDRLLDLLLAELQVPNSSQKAITSLRERAENILDVGGDLRLKAFVTWLVKFEGSVENMEGIAGLAANRPPKDWTDRDLDRAAVEVAALAQQFIRAENYARVAGREDKRLAMAVIVGMNGRPTPLHAEFEVTDSDKKEINDIVSRLEGEIDGGNKKKRQLTLAALAELSSRYMDQPEKTSDDT